MSEHILIKGLQWFVIFSGFIALLVDMFYYFKIKHHKSFSEFVRNLFVFGTKSFIKNLGVDDNRKKYLQVNNYCMVIFWLSIVIHFILLFALDKPVESY